MSAGRIYDVARAQRAALLRLEREAATELVRAYGDIWQRMRREIDFLLAEMDAAREVGEMTDASWLFERDRLTRLQAQVEAELRAYAQYADPLITQAQREAVEAALRNSKQLVQVTAGRAGVSANWFRLPNGELQDLIGFAGNGSPLRNVLYRLGPEAGERIRNGLLQGVAMGWNPERIAVELRDDFAGGLSKALTTCRTEVLRAYRETTHREYQTNDDVLEGWIWNAACTPRTCAMCWAMHGTVHPLTERLDDHPNGRCVPLPKLRDAPQWQPEPGADQFARLEPSVQKNILGSLYELYERGEISLSDVVGRRFDPDWGSMRYVRSKAAITGGR